MDYDLKSLLNSDIDDIMDLEDVLILVNMKRRRKQVQKLHSYTISHTEKSGWFTVVDDPARPDGKRKIRKSTEEALWAHLEEWYLENDSTKTTLEQVFAKWLD